MKGLLQRRHVGKGEAQYETWSAAVLNRVNAVLTVKERLESILP
jgi:hypothetical protein